MKICAVIAEYNPLHYGHLLHLNYIKNSLKAEKIIVVMSGNFTQRGEPALADKYTRAQWAVQAGADLVVELPTVFATANAETFAKGAINLINALNVSEGLCFGAETANKQDFITLASALNNETKEFKKELKNQLEKGVSLAKAKYLAVKALGTDFNKDLIAYPNNILGIEYTKALLKTNSDIEIYPMQRTGDHNATTLKKGITSASSIREAVTNGKIKKTKKCLPKYVYKQLPKCPPVYDSLVMGALLTSTAQEIAKTPDCTEGLENRLKALSKGNKDLKTLIEKATTKRYTSTRIQRILLCNLLKISEDFVKECSNAPLYAKVLALNTQSRSLLSEVCKKSSIPVITRSGDVGDLKKQAQSCFEKDVLANELYSLISKRPIKETHFVTL